MTSTKFLKLESSGKWRFGALFTMANIQALSSVVFPQTWIGRTVLRIRLILCWFDLGKKNSI
jgi:hypothetical protein